MTDSFPLNGKQNGWKTFHFMKLSSKVLVEREDYQNLVAAVQKYVVQEKQEGNLKKLLKEAKKTIAELKNTITNLKEKLAAVTKELAGYKSIRNQLYISELEQENDYLRGKIEKYDAVIEKNDLRGYFHKRKPAERDRGR